MPRPYGRRALCAPSQNGGVFVRLQPHQATTRAAGHTVSTGRNVVPTCEPSQNGCAFDRPQAHQDLTAPAGSFVT
jgi:hypothetical protein